jgi:putative colanic acid biosynthesis acetyltransferase WcaF
MTTPAPLPRANPLFGQAPPSVTRSLSVTHSPAAAERDLSLFTGAGYDKGRSRAWQVAWFAVMNVAFMKWWMPMRFRPFILRAFGAEIGERVRIRQNVRVLWPWKLVVGDDCWIGEGAWLLNLEPITLEDDVCLSQEAFLCTGSHRHRDPAFEFDNGPIHVGAGAWVAARAMVLRGTTIGDGAVVGAGSIARPATRESADQVLFGVTTEVRR